MLKLTTTLLLAIVAAAHAADEFLDARLLGTWRFEDSESVEELAFYPDHSFRSLDQNKYELSTPSFGDWRGTWRTDNNEIKIDSALVYIPTANKLRTGEYDTARDILTVRSHDGVKTLSYSRLKQPACDANSQGITRVSEAQFLGAWRIHCNMNDYQYRFLSHGKLLVFSPESADAEPLFFEAKWHVKGNNLVFETRKSSSTADQPKQAWPVIHIQKDCFSARDLDGFTQTFVRLR